MSGRPSNYARRLGQVVRKDDPDAAHQEQEQEQEPMIPAATTTPQRERPPRRRGGQRVRITVDLERSTHRALRLFAVEADTDASEVVRLLIARLLRDPAFAESIRAELEEEP